MTLSVLQLRTKFCTLNQTHQTNNLIGKTKIPLIDDTDLYVSKKYGRLLDQITSKTTLRSLHYIQINFIS